MSQFASGRWRVPALCVAVVAAGVALTSAVGAVGTSQSVFIGLNPPVRVLETRGAPDYTPVGVPVAAKVNGGSEVVLPVAGVNGVPANATAVMLNITAVNATLPTFVTVYPGPGNRPGVSTLNPAPGAVSFNAATVAIGSDGSIRLFNNAGSVDLIADLVGYYVPGSGGGTPGPTGPIGPIGPTGPQGPSGTSNVVTAVNELSLIEASPSASFVPVTGMAANMNVAAGKTIIAEWTGEVYCRAAVVGDSCLMRLTVDGLPYQAPVLIAQVATTNGWGTHVMRRVVTGLSSGLHTFAIEIEVPSAGTSMSLDSQVLTLTSI